MGEEVRWRSWRPACLSGDPQGFPVSCWWRVHTLIWVAAMGLAPRHPTCWPLGTGALPGGARAPSRKAAHKKTTTDPALFPIGSELFQGQAGRGVLSRPGRPDPAPAQSGQQPRVWHKDPRAQVAAGWGGGLHHQLKRQRGTRSRGHTQTRGNTWTRGAHPDTRGHAQTQGGAPGQGETPGHGGTPGHKGKHLDTRGS